MWRRTGKTGHFATAHQRPIMPPTLDEVATEKQGSAWVACERIKELDRLAELMHSQVLTRSNAGEAATVAMTSCIWLQACFCDLDSSVRDFYEGFVWSAVEEFEQNVEMIWENVLEFSGAMA